MWEGLGTSSGSLNYGSVEDLASLEVPVQANRKRRRGSALVATISLCVAVLCVACFWRRSLRGAVTLAAASPFDPSILFLEAWFATAAYCGNDDIISNSWSGPAAGFTTTKIVEVVESDLLAYVGYQRQQKYVQVTFRGTETANNWAVDLMALPLDTHYPDCAECMVHGGFWASEKLLIGPVLEELQALLSLHPGYDVYVSGHSLGGSLAMLAALDMADAGIAAKCYTFGMPRVGNRAWAEYTASKLPVAIRVTHDRDAVPHTPPQSFGFWHTGPEVFESATGNYTICEGPGENPACADRYPLWQTNVRDHLLYCGIDMTACRSLGWLDR